MMEHIWKPLSSGKAIDLLNPSEYSFTVTEIHNSLGRVKRFNGYGITVAQHSVMVAETILKITGNPYLALYGLFHDAAEAYIGDISTPVKHAIGESIYRLEESILDEINAQLVPRSGQLHLGYVPFVKWVDAMALRYELNDLIAEGRYKDNEHWAEVNKIAITKYMKLPHKTFAAYYYHLLDLCEESAAYEEYTVELENGRSFNIFCKRGECKLEDLY